MPKNTSLKELLDSSVNEIDESTLDRIAKNSVHEFERSWKFSANSSPSTGYNWSLLFSWKSLGLYASLFFAAIFIFHYTGDLPPGNNTHLAKNDTGLHASMNHEGHLVQELQKVFPDTLKAVFLRKGSIEVSLSHTTTPKNKRPIIITLHKHNEKTTIISFSGENINISLGNEIVNFDVLLTSEDNVIIAGDDLFLNADQTIEHNGYKITSTTLDMYI